MSLELLADTQELALLCTSINSAGDESEVMQKDTETVISVYRNKSSPCTGRRDEANCEDLEIENKNELRSKQRFAVVTTNSNEHENSNTIKPVQPSTEIKKKAYADDKIYQSSSSVDAPNVQVETLDPSGMHGMSSLERAYILELESCDALSHCILFS